MARCTASSSRLFPAAERPIRPLYLRQACSAIAVSFPVEHPGKSSLLISPEYITVIVESIGFAEAHRLRNVQRTEKTDIFFSHR